MARDIVHVLVSLGYGGIETWLVKVFRQREALRARSIVVLIGDPQPGAASYVDEVAAMGIPIHHVPFSFTGVPYVRRLAALLRTLRPRVLHGHLNYLSGLSTLAARLAGVPTRISHYHIPFPAQHRSLPRRLYIAGAHLCERLSATRILGCSPDTLASHFGTHWTRDARASVLHCAVDVQPFAQPMRRADARAALQLPADALVLGHIGRFNAQKNHVFLIQVFQAVQARAPHAHLLLVGDGDLRPQVEGQVAALGLTGHVHFLGICGEIAPVLAACDAFVFPSLFEGLGLVVVEAQAAGLPCIIADTIPRDAEVVPALITRRALADSPDVWTEAILAAVSAPRPSPAACLAAVAGSAFSLEATIHALEAAYAQEVPDARPA